MKKIRYSICRIIGKDGVFVCLFLYLMNYNYLLKRFKVFLSPNTLRDLARDVGFVQRTSKYQTKDLVALCIWMSQNIATTFLAHMKEEIIPVLMDVIKTNNIPAIREAIDAIGFICFYNKIHSNTQIIDALILCLGNNFNDNIILWKLVRAFESFNDINVIKILMEIEQNDSQLVIRNEAKRSLKIINNRTNN
ncbi:hypothetical protein BGV83_25090 [Bacillus anthracis]|nr:hypothetical protein BGV83_25090 [Bacillus anthracis]